MPSVDEVLPEVNSVRVVGGSGYVIIIAPLPGFDEVDAPLTFIAIIVAKIDEP